LLAFTTVDTGVATGLSVLLACKKVDNGVATVLLAFKTVDKGVATGLSLLRGSARAGDAQGTPTQSHLSPSVL